MRSFVDAVTFLTRVPAGAEVHDDARIARAVPWFPVVGAAVGAVVAGVYVGLLAVVPPLVAAVVAIGCGVLITGAFHEDGLADVADAFGGGTDREDRLRILKDPRLGTYGVLAVVLSALARIACLAALSRREALLSLPAMHALSRAAAVGAMTGFPSISEGLGASYTRSLSAAKAAVGVVAGVALASALVRTWVLVGAPVAALCAAAVGVLAMRKIGGVNGDVLGAIEQVAEVALLVLFVGLAVA